MKIMWVFYEGHQSSTCLAIKLLLFPVSTCECQGLFSNNITIDPILMENCIVGSSPSKCVGLVRGRS